MNPFIGMNHYHTLYDYSKYPRYEWECGQYNPIHYCHHPFNTDHKNIFIQLSIYAEQKVELSRFSVYSEPYSPIHMRPSSDYEIVKPPLRTFVHQLNMQLQYNCPFEIYAEVDRMSHPAKDDLKINCHGTQFSVRCSLMTSRSNVIYNFCRVSPDTIFLDIDANQMAEVLDYLYYGHIEFADVRSVYEAASFLNLSSLVDACEDILIDQIDFETFVDLYEWARHCNGLDDLVELIYEFVIDNDVELAAQKIEVPETLLTAVLDRLGVTLDKAGNRIVSEL